MLNQQFYTSRPVAIDSLAPRQTILLVEDNAELRNIIRTFLGQCGFMVLEAGDGEEAVVMERSYSGQIDLLLTDVVMPKASGPEAALHICSGRPNMKVLYMSGCDVRSLPTRCALNALAPFLQKPFELTELAGKIDELLSATKHSNV